MCPYLRQLLRYPMNRLRFRLVLDYREAIQQISASTTSSIGGIAPGCDATHEPSRLPASLILSNDDPFR